MIILLQIICHVLESLIQAFNSVIFPAVGRFQRMLKKMNRKIECRGKEQSPYLHQTLGTFY